MERVQLRYRTELEKNPAQVELLRAALNKGPATMLYGAHDEEHNDAVVLKHFLEMTIRL
jgi:uncharacterized protein YeaO (DUF488 family)